MPESKAPVTERIIIGGENNRATSAASRLSLEMVQKFDGKSKEVNTPYIGTLYHMILLFLFQVDGYMQCACISLILVILNLR
jgi:hypothetical protein